MTSTSGDKLSTSQGEASEVERWAWKQAKLAPRKVNQVDASSYLPNGIVAL